MILCSKDMIVCKGGSIIAAVTEVYGTIQHGNLHFFQGTYFSIIISNIFHSVLLLQLLLLYYINYITGIHTFQFFMILYPPINSVGSR